MPRNPVPRWQQIFALPGSLHNPMVKGCHRLIREGARLVETVSDVMTELAPLASVLAGELQNRVDASPDSTGSTHRPAGSIPDDPEYRMLMGALEFDPRTVDELVTLTKLPVQSVSSMLLMLELQGLVELHSSGRYSAHPQPIMQSGVE